MTESVWAQIARLRIKDPHLLAPAIESAWDRGRMACVGRSINVARPDTPEDVVSLQDVTMIESLRVQALQSIYFSQGTSKVSNVLKGWHAYGCAFDLIHREYEWFTNRASVMRWPNPSQRARASLLWYRAVATHFTAGNVLVWGGNAFKTFPDSPHFQSAITPITPPQSTVDLYNAAGGGLAGRRAVWARYHIG